MHERDDLAVLDAALAALRVQVGDRLIREQALAAARRALAPGTPAYRACTVRLMALEGEITALLAERDLVQQERERRLRKRGDDA